jgi:hypothetical protein
MTNPAAQSPGRWPAATPVALTLLLLGGAVADKFFFHPAPSDAAPDQAVMRQAAPDVPYDIGPWVGADAPVPVPAVAMLRPGVILSRQYHGVRTGRTAGLLIVRCEDARDLLGLDPPVWYAAHGWSRIGTVATEGGVDGEAITVTSYTFTSGRTDRTSDLRVDSFVVLPDGRTCRDIDAVEAAARGFRGKFFGAAQVQIVTDTEWGDSEREELFRQLIRAAGPLLRATRGGMTR